MTQASHESSARDIQAGAASGLALSETENAWKYAAKQISRKDPYSTTQLAACRW
jgi:hypothetical protein